MNNVQGSWKKRSLKNTSRDCVAGITEEYDREKEDIVAVIEYAAKIVAKEEITV